MRKVILFLVMVLLSCVSHNPVESAAIWYVNGALGTDDGVHGTGPGASAFKTIQYAVNDPRVTNGDTINVAPGTYVEQIAVGKTLTLIGAGQSSTTIQAPYNGLVQDVDGKRNIVEVRGSHTLIISGVTITGPGGAKLPGSQCIIDVGVSAVGGATLNMMDSTVKDVIHIPFGSTYCGEGIRIGTPRGASVHQEGHGTIRNVIVSGYMKNGIVVAGPLSTATIEGNTVTGVVPNTANAQNGIQISYGAVATIVNNEVSDNWCGPRFNCGPNPFDPIAPYQSSGILLYQAGASTVILENGVFNNDVGIYNISNGRITITANRLDGNRYEGIVLDQGDALVTYNTIEGGNMGVAVLAFDANTGNSQGTLTGNTITAAQRGVQILDQNPADVEIPTLVAYCNNIIANTIYGMDNATSNSVNAENNWWGCGTGPGTPGCDTVSGNVDYDPWATSAGSIVVTASPAEILADGTSTSTITAYVTDMCGMPVPDGIIVAWSTTEGTVDSTSTTTGGNAVTTLTSSTNPAIATVTALVNIGGTMISGQANVIFIAPPHPSLPARYQFYYSLRPLAENNIGRADEYRIEVENLLKLAQEKRLDVSRCKAFYDMGMKYMEEAKRFMQGSNFLAASNFAILAQNELRKALDCLWDLLG
jgi:parallel beta-helix repeat protein